MQITFKAKSRNTFPAEQIYQNVIYVKFMKKHKLYTVEYKSGIEGKTAITYVSDSYFIEKVEE